jgi:hypothetical protein
VSDFGERARPGENHDEPSKAAEPPTGTWSVTKAPSSLPPLILEQLRLKAPGWLQAQSRLGTRRMVRHRAPFGHTPASFPLEVSPPDRVLIQGLSEMLGTAADTDGEKER